MARQRIEASEQDGSALMSASDAFACKVLRVQKTESTSAAQESAQAIFSYSMALSGLRCIISYVIMPFVLPALGLGAAATLGPAIGIPVGILAIAFDIKGMRRFFSVQYKYRWQMAWIYLSIISLISYLVLADIYSLIK